MSGHSQSSPLPKYFAVWGALLIGTLITYEAAKLDLGMFNAAVALIRMNRPQRVWTLLKHGEDPRVRSYLIHRLGPMGSDPRVLVRRLPELAPGPLPQRDQPRPQGVASRWQLAGVPQHDARAEQAVDGWHREF